jgi:hypothetical protein
MTIPTTHSTRVSPSATCYRFSHDNFGLLSPHNETHARQGERNTLDTNNSSPEQTSRFRTVGVPSPIRLDTTGVCTWLWLDLGFLLLGRRRRHILDGVGKHVVAVAIENGRQCRIVGIQVAQLRQLQ